MSALCHKCGCTIDEDELTLCGECSKPAAVPSAEEFLREWFNEYASEEPSGLCDPNWQELMARIEARDAAQRQTGREDMREILNEAMEAMDERRCYLDIWEWKYGERWDREDSAIRKALSDLENGRKG